MANTTRQNSLLVNQDWTRVYESFRNADFQSYDYQTLRKSMLEYLQIYYPEDFNDFIESSEYIALIDLIAFLGQSLAFRTDLNARENFIDTAERRESVLKLAKLISYNPKRNQTSTGFLKFNSVRTTETLRDSDGVDLSNLTVLWNDSSNTNWYEQFVIVLNAALNTGQQIGKPANSKTIASILHEEYNINTPPAVVPVFPFTSEIEGQRLRFEAVSATTANKDYVYEASPLPGSPMNIMYRNDGQGNASNSTGFFVYFKQGELQNTSFNISESIPNNIVNINVDDINNTDVWLFERNSNNQLTEEWNQVLAVQAKNIIYNDNAAKKSYQVNTRSTDQIDLVFGDGTFAAIPRGAFTAFYRVSAGTSYKITPSEMQNIAINIPYISKTGRQESLSIVVSLEYTVASALAAETTEEIRSRAPQQYYTQNRMVTGEDYNTFPYSNFSSISKVKAVNRTSSGTSRFLDTVDTTGRYSSTNIFGEDGIIYRQDYVNDSVKFTFSTRIDINRAIQNQILPIIRGRDLLHYYYQYFNRFELTDLSWVQSTTGSSSSTGYFVNSQSVPQQIGDFATGTVGYLDINALVIFSPGLGRYFNNQNQIATLPRSGVIPPGGRDKIVATITNLTGTGGQGVLNTGLGPVSLSEIVPEGASAQAVIPAFSNDFSAEFSQTLISLISGYAEFGVRYDQASQTWKIINKVNLVTNRDNSGNYIFSQTNQGRDRDSSWLLNFTLSNTTYTVEIRGLRYVFESLRDTKFYYDTATKIFDPITGRTVNDHIKILRVNENVQHTGLLQSDIQWSVNDRVVDNNGFVNNSKIYLTYSDKNDDGVPDDPDIFNTISGSGLIFFKKISSDTEFTRYEVVDPEVINSDYSDLTQLQPLINDYPLGQIFFTTSLTETTGARFYQIQSRNGARSLVNITQTTTGYPDYRVNYGRQNLMFQYRHNALSNRRIDPSPANIIDLYILTKEYETSYRTWALNNNGTATEPARPTSEELRLQFETLENYKSVSDALIYNSAKFKPLFGTAASPELRATFKVIKNPAVNLSDSEIRTQVLRYINLFFAEGNWDFGDTFYFTELATYIQQSLAPNISSIVIVPAGTGQIYGSLHEIGSESDEILISVATVDNIEIIPSITAAQLGFSGTATITN